MKKKVPLNPFLQQYMNFYEDLAAAMPNFARALGDDENTFRGLTVFIGDDANYVIGFKRFGAEGVPEVLWTSGDDPLAMFMQLERALKAKAFKIDKRAAMPSPS